jgi:GTPase SAR1 family protein
MVELPTQKSEIKEVDPKLLIIYGLPKCGKSTLTASLPNALHLQLDKRGADYISAMSYPINSLQDIANVDEAIKSGKYNYTFTIIDTVTELEDLVLPYAAQLYKSTIQGRNWTGTDVKTLPNGSGYLFLRQAFAEIINLISSWSPYTILLGHVKEKMIDKRGTEVSVVDLDLTGKLKSSVSGNADAIGYLYRKDNQTLISFNNSTESVVCGSRIRRLSNKTIPVIEEINGELQFNWSEIYTFLK